MNKMFKTLSAVAALGIVGIASQARAASVLTSGDVVDGWAITFPVGIALVSDGGDQLTLEKFAAFSTDEGLSITFLQVAPSASSNIVITDESLTNVTGAPFTGFQFLLANTLDDAKFTSSFNLDDAAENKFTSQTVTPDDITMTGTLANLDTAKLGFNADGGQITIAADPSHNGSPRVFDFKEIPVTAVPIPAAAWTGLSGLLGLGMLSASKKMKKVLA